MNLRIFGMLALAASAFLIPAPALAHHGRALIYEAKKETTVKASVTEFVWSNPHVQIGIEAVDDKGARRQWLLERRQHRHQPAEPRRQQSPEPCVYK